MAIGFYELLQVSPDASPEAIRAAYQEQVAQVVRKARAAEARQQDLAAVEARRQSLAEAYAILSDAARRRKYDRFREVSKGTLPTDPEELWNIASPSLVDPAAAAALEVVRTLTDLKVGDPFGVRAEPEAPRTDPRVTRVEAPRAEVPRVEVPRVEPSRQDTPKAEPLRVENPRVEAARAEAPRVEIPRPESGRNRSQPPAKAPPPKASLPPQAAKASIPPQSSKASIPPPSSARATIPPVQPPSSRASLPPRAPPMPERKYDAVVMEVIDEDEVVELAPTARVAVPNESARREVPRIDPARLESGRAEVRVEEAVEPRESRSARVEVKEPSRPKQKVFSAEDIARVVDQYGPTGSCLRVVREARGITLQELSHTTRISQRFLEALEKDAYHDLPAATFVRGYVKMVARMLHLVGTGPEIDEFVDGYMARFHRNRG